MDKLSLQDMYQQITGKPVKKLTEYEMLDSLLHFFEKNQQCLSMLTKVDSNRLLPRKHSSFHPFQRNQDWICSDVIYVICLFANVAPNDAIKFIALYHLNEFQNRRS